MEVVALPGDLLGPASEVLAAAFHDDPMFGWLWPRPAHRRQLLRAMLGASAAAARRLYGESYTIIEGGRPAGVACWVPPGQRPSLERDPRAALAMWRVVLQPLTLPAGVRILAAVERARPKERHWYLETLAVDPRHQGRGVGARLISVNLERAERDGLPVYLETSKEANVAWYARHGFEVREEVRPSRKAPPVWTMWRASR